MSGIILTPGWCSSVFPFLCKWILIVSFNIRKKVKMKFHDKTTVILKLFVNLLTILSKTFPIKVVGANIPMHLR